MKAKKVAPSLSHRHPLLLSGRARRLMLVEAEHG